MVDLRREMDPIYRTKNKPTRPPKRYTVSRKMSILRNPPEDEQEVLPGSFTNLHDVSLVQSPHNEWGPDVEQMHEPLSDDEGTDVAHRALEIWRQFASDVVQKIGNPMGTKARTQEESYCILPPCVKRVTNEGWTTTFDYLFPSPNHLLPASHQHYAQMRYYEAWLRLMGSIDSGDIRTVRRAVKDEFNKLAWAPAAQVDRVWIYKSADGLVAFPAGSARVTHAPRIVWNPKRKLQPQFQPPLRTVSDLREEEEESSDEAEQ